jgi:hypothetical protein
VRPNPSIKRQALQDALKAGTRKGRCFGAATTN